PPTGSQPSGRAGETLPDPVAERLEQQHLPLRALDRNPRRHDPRVVDDHQRITDLGREVGEPPVPAPATSAVVDEQPRLIPPVGRVLRDQLRREVVLQLGCLHPVDTLSSPSWIAMRSSGPATGLPRLPRRSPSRATSTLRSIAPAPRSRPSPRQLPSSRRRCPSESAKPSATGSGS